MFKALWAARPPLQLQCLLRTTALNTTVFCIWRQKGHFVCATLTKSGRETKPKLGKHAQSSHEWRKSTELVTAILYLSVFDHTPQINFQPSSQSGWIFMKKLHLDSCWLCSLCCCRYSRNRPDEPFENSSTAWFDQIMWFLFFRIQGGFPAFWQRRQWIHIHQGARDGYAVAGTESHRGWTHGHDQRGRCGWCVPKVPHEWAVSRVTFSTEEKCFQQQSTDKESNGTKTSNTFLCWKEYFCGSNFSCVLETSSIKVVCRVLRLCTSYKLCAVYPSWTACAERTLRFWRYTITCLLHNLSLSSTVVEGNVRLPLNIPVEHELTTKQLAHARFHDLSRTR